MINKSVAEIANIIGGEIIGDGHARISGFSGIKEAKTGELTFLANQKYLPLLNDTKASAIIVSGQINAPGKTLIRVDNPSLAFTQIVDFFLQQQPALFPCGIHPTAIIADSAKLGNGVAIGPYVVIESGAIIGDGVTIAAFSYVGHGALVGDKTFIYPHVTIREKVNIGKNCIVHSGAVIGSDGYGYTTVDGKHLKIPQVGIVIVEDDVEIGANVTIDRARFDKTLIGQGTKIDNLVHIAHNVIIGKHCLIVAQVGISGSSQLGNYVVLAGQVGVVGHLSIGDGAVVAAQSGVSKSIKAGEQVYGSPAKPMKEAFKTNAYIQRLDHYVSIINELKARVAALEEKR